MTSSPTSGQSPFEAWNRLFEPFQPFQEQARSASTSGQSPFEAWNRLFEPFQPFQEQARSASTSGQNPFEAWNRLFDPFLPFQMTRCSEKEERQSEERNPWMVYLRQAWKANPWSKIIPLDPAELCRVSQTLWFDSVTHPMQFWFRSSEFAQKYQQLLASTTLKSWGVGGNLPPVIEPEKGDKRFTASAWQVNPFFDFLKQNYLLVASTLLKSVSEKEGLTAMQQRKLVFYMRQFLDAISPTNTLFTNPEVLQETFQSGGQNLIRGMQNLMRDMQQGQIKMTDTDAFEPGRNLATTPGQVVYRNELIELIQYAPATEQVYAIPLLFIPPWINKYYVLDMQPDNSLVAFLVGRGYNVFVVSWKNPDASMEGTTFEDYLSRGLITAMEVSKEISGSPKVNIVGYCVGGTLLALALSYLEAMGDTSINAATFLVTLLDYSEVGDTGVFMDEPQIEFIERQMAQRGYLDSRSMATMFNLLRANDLIWSNVINNYLLGKEPPAFDLLYWNNDGIRMASTAHAFYLRNTYLENNLIKPNKLVIKGVPIDLSRIRQDIYAVGTQQDHIVPWQSAWQITQLVNGPVRFVLAGSGHIAGVISPPKKGRGYWTNEKRTETASQWLEDASPHKGSWWTDWVEWLSLRSGEQRAARAPGSAAHPLLEPAPGLYVLEH